MSIWLVPESGWDVIGRASSPVRARSTETTFVAPVPPKIVGPATRPVDPAVLTARDVASERRRMASPVLTTGPEPLIPSMSFPAPRFELMTRVRRPIMVIDGIED